jgi:hypothetical protein
MSECIEAPKRDRRETNPRRVQFTIHNPKVRLSQQAIEALARLLLADEEKRPVQQDDVAA